MLETLFILPKSLSHDRLRPRPGESGHRLRDLLSIEEGLSLVETLVSTAILAVVIVMLASAFSTGTMAVRKGDTRITAENLARNQLEHTKTLPYLPAPSSYASIAPLPAGYSLLSQASAVSGRDSNLQKVTVTVYREGKPILTMENLRLK